MEWMLLPLRRYAEFSGRSRRKEFWLFFLFQFLVSAAIGIVFGRPSYEQYSGFFGFSTSLTGPGGVVQNLFGLAMFIPSLAVSVRRLHDIDRSGWFLLLYAASALGGNLVALLVHRKNPGYSSVGSSGAINGLIFAAIVLNPGMRIFFLPGWLFGVIFILFSIYGIRSGKNNIGHESHLGGALTGMLVAIAIHPASVVDNTVAIVLMFLPTVAFMIVIITRPQLLFVDNYWFTHKYNYTVDDRYNAKKRNSEQEVDRILDKINQRGINSLSKRERESLEEYSRK